MQVFLIHLLVMLLCLHIIATYLEELERIRHIFSALFLLTLIVLLAVSIIDVLVVK